MVPPCVAYDTAPPPTRGWCWRRAEQPPDVVGAGVTAAPPPGTAPTCGGGLGASGGNVVRGVSAIAALWHHLACGDIPSKPWSAGWLVCLACEVATFSGIRNVSQEQECNAQAGRQPRVRDQHGTC